MTWLNNNPDLQSIRVAACDLNGQARGKRVPRQFADKALSDGIRFPYSVLNLDITGADIENSPLVFASGDPDGVLRPTERGPVPLPWLENSALLPVWMFRENDDFLGDPRHALAKVLARYTAKGLTPVVAAELEFYLLENHGKSVRAAPDPKSGQAAQTDTLSLATLDAFEPFFDALYAGAAQMGIPADAATSEAAPGQFEINLMHDENAMRAADNIWLFKMLIKGTARQHGLTATFAPKPFADQAGNGMHTHFSILDQDANNIFANSAEILESAVAGCLNAMPASTLVFAPFANSYARLTPNAHAPTAICWAQENRTASIRIPAGPKSARRIEHRVSGGDANPYLMLATILGAALTGIEKKSRPPAPITGNAYTQNLAQLPNNWGDAISAFKQNHELPPELIKNFIATKRQELGNDVAETRVSLILDTA